MDDGKRYTNVDDIPKGKSISNSVGEWLDSEVFPGRKIICPNPKCDYKGSAEKQPRGSIFIGLFLCLLFILPGLFYFIVRSGSRYYCPKCGIQIANEN